jgi:hypothetical protein
MDRRLRRANRPAPWQLVHVHDDGGRTFVGAPLATWDETVLRANRVVEALRAEVASGNPDATGVVWVVDTRNGTIVQRRPITEEPPAEA